jgi:hypothetical protein
MPLETFRIERKESINKSKQLHNSFVLTDILVSLQQVLVLNTIASLHGQFSRTLLRRDDGEDGIEADNCDGLLSTLIGSGNSQIQIMGFKEFRRNILQVESCKLRKLLGDTFKDLVIEVPSLAELVRIPILSKLSAPLAGLGQISSKRLVERHFSESLWSLQLLLVSALTISKNHSAYLFKHVMQWL